jgi:hypothetical protein
VAATGGDRVAAVQPRNVSFAIGADQQVVEVRSLDDLDVGSSPAHMLTSLDDLPEGVLTTDLAVDELKQIAAAHLDVDIVGV